MLKKVHFLPLLKEIDKALYVASHHEEPDESENK